MCFTHGAKPFGEVVRVNELPGLYVPLTFDATGPSTQPSPGVSSIDQHTGSGPSGACTGAASTTDAAGTAMTTATATVIVHTIADAILRASVFPLMLPASRCLPAVFPAAGVSCRCRFLRAV